jgi:hypothetical protein
MHSSIRFAKQVTAREYKKPASEWNSSEYAMKRKEQFKPVLLNVYGAPELIPMNEFRQPM